MQHFFIQQGTTLVPVNFQKPYSEEAQHFAMLFYRNYCGQVTCSEIARYLSIPESTLRRWVRKDRSNFISSKLF